ncbi:hypothetical protein ABTL53_19450, partial [Acinetobacter baumannii]
MKNLVSALERHAAELGLTQEDAALMVQLKPPVSRSDKVLLAVACGVLSIGVGALNVWLIVPTFVISGI